MVISFVLANTLDKIAFFASAVTIGFFRRLARSLESLQITATASISFLTSSNFSPVIANSISDFEYLDAEGNTLERHDKVGFKMKGNTSRQWPEYFYYDDNGNYLIENFKSQLLKNKKIVIFGSGAQKLDFLYSKDLSKVILKLCIMNIKNKTLNLCTGSGVKISEIANSLVNDKKSIVYQNNKGGDLSLVGNNEKLSKLINYYPKNNIRFILKKLK